MPAAFRNSHYYFRLEFRRQYVSFFRIEKVLFIFITFLLPNASLALDYHNLGLR